MDSSLLPAFFECLSPTCRFRFPILTRDELKFSQACPRCSSPTLLVEPRQFRSASLEEKSLPPTHLEVLVDNIRSAHNVGSIFRIADGAGIEKIHLGGLTPTPENPSVVKTSLGAEKKVSWNYHPNAKLIVNELKEKKILVWALETGVESESIFEITYPVPLQPILLVVGNEVSGVDPGILALADKRLMIPMRGAKESLNVSSAFSIAAYTLKWQLSPKKKSPIKPD